METRASTVALRLAVIFGGGVAVSRGLSCAPRAVAKRASASAGSLGGSLEKLLKVIFVPALAHEANVNGGDAALAIDHERGRERVDAAVEVRHFVVAQEDAVIDAGLGDEGLDGLPPVLVHRYADNGKSLPFVLALELDEPGDLDAAGIAPCGPKIQQHDFAAKVGKLHESAVGVLEREVGSGLAGGLGLEVRRSGLLGRGAAGQHQRGYQRRGVGLTSLKNGVRQGDSVSIISRSRRGRARGGPGPRRRVAEALADVLAPAARAAETVTDLERSFPRFGRPAELAPRLPDHFVLEEELVGEPGGIAGAQPDEMKQLMYQHAGQLGGLGGEAGFHHDFTPMDERAGVDLGAGIASRAQLSPGGPQFRAKAEMQRPPAQAWHRRQDLIQSPPARSYFCDGAMDADGAGAASSTILTWMLVLRSSNHFFN